MTDSCKGCMLYRFNKDDLVYDYKCLISKYKPEKISECPCGICLLKMICQTGCSPLRKFRIENNIRSASKLIPSLYADDRTIYVSMKNR